MTLEYYNISNTPTEEFEYFHQSVCLPSSSFRVRLAISLISMRDRERECVAEMMGVGVTVAGAGVVINLLTRGDLSGLSTLRPTRLHSGILKMCLHAVSPGNRNQEAREEDGKGDNRGWRSRWQRRGDDKRGKDVKQRRVTMGDVWGRIRGGGMCGI